MKKTTKIAVTLAAISVMVLGAATMVSADEKNGWLEENGAWYYYADDVKVANNWAKSGADWYFLGDDGKMQTKKFVNNDQKWVEARADIDDATRNDYYYVDAAGKMVTGWLEVQGDDVKSPSAEKADSQWYFFDANGKMHGDAWIKGATAWYYVNEDGAMLTNALIVSDKKDYILDKDGAMITGWYKAAKDVVDKDDVVVVEKDDWVWAKTSGEMKKNNWEKINSKWYFFESYVMASDKEITIEDETFLLTKNGDMLTGWYRADRDSDWNYYGSNGVKALDKLVKVTSSGSTKYYLFEDDGKAVEEGVYYVDKNIDKPEFADFAQLTELKDGETVVVNNYAKVRNALTKGWVVYELGTAKTGNGLKAE